MPNVNDFKGIPPITWGFIVSMVIGTIIPGLLLVFLFRQDLFMEVETI
jgi:predicted membrane protein